MINWEEVAVASACRLQYEQACGRSALITEDFSRIVLAEAIQVHTAGGIQPEYNHPDLPGDARIDLVVRSPQAGNIEAAIEHKWIRSTTAASNRNWMPEVIGDLIRLERLDVEMVQASERLLIISGEVEEMRQRFWERQANHAGTRQRVVEGLLQSRPVAGGTALGPSLIQLHGNGEPFRAILQNGSGLLFDALPARYQVQLVGYHRAKADGVECAAWRITRPRGQRVTFNGASRWP